MTDAQKSIARCCVFIVAACIVTLLAVIADVALESTPIAHPSRTVLVMISGYWITRQVLG